MVSCLRLGRRNSFLLIYVCLVCSLLVSCATGSHSAFCKRNLSPNDFGLSRARSGEERFRVLYKTHTAAVAAGVNVSYAGIKHIDLEIPQDAVSIPLTENNDFSGVEFRVRNTKKHFYLFLYSPKSTAISVSKRDIDRGNFRSYPQLAQGRVLLTVSDDNPWVENREGYKYGHTRKDILLLKNGQAQNKTVMPYNNTNSSPSCSFYPLRFKGMTVSNVSLQRSANSTFKTYLMNVSGVDGLTLENVSIHTPENQGESDVAITIKDCTNVTFENVRIEGTYSRSDYSGYGVSMNNIWNFKVRKMYGHGNWGVFGTNNVNVASFEDSDINRFDIHCYGRDVSFKNVTFRDKYNQFASVFGTISFEGCTFIDFTPIVNGPSYNAYVGYDVVMKDCVIEQSQGTAVLIDEGYIDNRVNSRPELSSRCLPNIDISNLTIQVGEKVQKAYLFYFRERSIGKQDIQGLSTIQIDGLRFQYDGDGVRTPADFYTSNVSVDVKSPVRQTIRNVDLIGNAVKPSQSKGKLIHRLEMKSPKSALRSSNVKANGVGR